MRLSAAATSVAPPVVAPAAAAFSPAMSADVPALSDPPMSEASSGCSIVSAAEITPAFCRSWKGWVVEAK